MRFNELLGRAAAYARGLRAILGLDEQEGVTTVAPEIFPVLIADSLIEPENRVLMGSRLVAGGIGDPAVAANFSHGICRNPAGSNVVATIFAHIANVGAAAVDYNVTVRPPGTVDDTFGMAHTDRRIAGVPPLTTHSRTQVASIGSDYVFHVAATESTYRLPHPYVLSPGNELVIGPTNALTRVDLVFFGYYRELGPSESAAF